MATPKQPEKETQQVFPATVPRAYLKPKDLQKFSMWHRAYVGDPTDKTKLHQLEILGGTIRNLDTQTYQRFADAGILTTERPRRGGDDDD